MRGKKLEKSELLKPKRIPKSADSALKNWNPIYKGMHKEAIKTSFRNNRQYTLAKDKYTSTAHDNFMAMAIAIRDRLVERWIISQQSYHKLKVKRVYYLSLEFLIGRLLGSNIINLGLWDQAKQALAELGIDIEDLLEQESDAGLGNGGLGRLAACFLDSMATLGIPAHGYGIRYDYGIFHQKIINGNQVEYPDEWLKKGNPWEFARPEYSVEIKFYGNIYMFQNKEGRLQVRWADTQNVLAMPYDIPVPGYNNQVVNTLRLWSARSSEEFDLEYFNYGDYERAVYNKLFSENISKVLYPNDGVSQGRELRLKQEYFFTAASVSDIIRRFKVDNDDLRALPDKVAIQLNDTHPSLAVVEFMRLLIDQENFDWDTAWDITVRIFGYTNHTVMPEALEYWPLPLFERLLPRHMQIIYEINFRFLRDVANKFPGDNDRLRRMSLIEEAEPKRIRMAYLCIIGSHSVNGVSDLHSQLLKGQLFKDFYEFSPGKFNNKTNGITQRRWLKKANPRLADLISGAIGDKWVTDLYQLKKLLPFTKDAAFKEKWRQIKSENKRQLADYIYSSTGIPVNSDFLFDAQVKRIHEYKRQILFVFYIISQYIRAKQAGAGALTARTFIFSGKAAPGYSMAKLIIKFINSVAETVNRDKQVNGRFNVVFLENYRVSLAEKIFRASDVSEQISTAGTEASGTGCMKFMINGALTIGALDGANIEIVREAGEDNVFTFGLSYPQLAQLRASGYNPRDYIQRSELLKEVVSLVRSNFFSPLEPGIFEPLMNNLLDYDQFFVCADFDDYCRVQDLVSELYADKNRWVEKAIINTASSGKFSSDRTILEYNKNIWKAPCGEAACRRAEKEAGDA